MSSGRATRKSRMAATVAAVGIAGASAVLGHFNQAGRKGNTTVQAGMTTADIGFPRKDALPPDLLDQKLAALWRDRGSRSIDQRLVDLRRRLRGAKPLEVAEIKSKLTDIQREVEGNPTLKAQFQGSLNSLWTEVKKKSGNPQQ
ncbi:hypothetical protein HZC07_02735 [Candidatus Micrarchaeota archaeon]|nr:hypothetical protein [Candidatus Micrarchaeota archaeon]